MPTTPSSLPSSAEVKARLDRDMSGIEGPIRIRIIAPPVSLTNPPVLSSGAELCINPLPPLTLLKMDNRSVSEILLEIDKFVAELKKPLSTDRPVSLPPSTESKRLLPAQPVRSSKPLSAEQKILDLEGNFISSIKNDQWVGDIPAYPLHATTASIKGNVALITSGLTEAGLGMELLGEADVAEANVLHLRGFQLRDLQLRESFLFKMMSEVAWNAKRMGKKLRQSLDAHGVVSMELNELDAPPLFIDPHSGHTCVLLGLPVPDALMPSELKGKTITVRLLTFDECLVVRRFGVAGCKALAELFARDQTHHVSSMRVITKAQKLEEEKKLAEVKALAVVAPPALDPNFKYLAALPALGDDKIWNPESAPDSKYLQKAAIDGGLLVDINMQGIWEKLAQLTSIPGLFRLLPPMDENAESKLASTVYFKEFAKPAWVSNAMCRFDMRLRQLALHKPSSGADVLPSVGFAKHVINTLHTQIQIAGWWHFEEYVRDADGYITRMARRGRPGPSGEVKAVERPEEPTDESSSPLSILHKQGKRLVNRMLQRLEWLEKLQIRKGEAFNPDLYLGLLAVDKEWMDETGRFMKDAEKEVTELLKQNPARYGVYRDLQRRGVAWPHNKLMRKNVEAAGFVFRPMMVKRDRCVCEICDVEVSGWRPWFNPWQMHDLTKHNAEFKELVNRCSGVFSQTGLYPDVALPSDEKDMAASAAAAAYAAVNATVRQPAPKQ